MPSVILPPINLGTARLNRDDLPDAVEVIATAIELGYRFIDTAQGYETEEHIPKALARTSNDQNDIFVSTKVSADNLHYEGVRRTAEESRTRLATNVIYLLYVHRPTESYDPDETLRAFESLQQRGVIKHFGVSNFTLELLNEATSKRSTPILAHQIEMHPLLQQDQLVADAHANYMYLIAYGPLMNGDVFGVPELEVIAEKHGVTEAAVSPSWLAAQQNVVPIPMASRESNLRANLLAATELELDEKDI